MPRLLLSLPLEVGIWSGGSSLFATPPLYCGKVGTARGVTLLTLPQILQTEGFTLQSHQCAPVGDSGHFQSPESRYSLSPGLINLFVLIAILLPPEYNRFADGEHYAL